MIRYYTYYNYGGYKTLLLGCEEEKEESTYYLPLLPIDEKKLEEKPDEKLKEKVERQKKLASISVITNQSENNLSSEASVALSHGGYKLIYQTTADGRRFISLRDIEAEKDDTGRDAPFLMIWEGDSAEDWLKMDTLAEYLRKNLSEIEGRLPKLFEYDPVNNGLRFHIGPFNEYMMEIMTSKGCSETKQEAEKAENTECDQEEKPVADETETTESNREEDPDADETETSEGDQEEEPVADDVENFESDQEKKPVADEAETFENNQEEEDMEIIIEDDQTLCKVILLVVTPGTSIDVPIRELKIDKSDILTAEDTNGVNLIDNPDCGREQSSSTSNPHGFPKGHKVDSIIDILEKIDEKAIREEVDKGVRKMKETLPKVKRFLGDFLSDKNL